MSYETYVIEVTTPTIILFISKGISLYKTIYEDCCKDRTPIYFVIQVEISYFKVLSISHFFRYRGIK